MEDTKDHLSGIKVPNIVVGVLVYNQKDEILLAQIPRWKNKWVVVGGHVEYGEELEECAKREVKEETNLEVTDLEFVQVQEAIFSQEFDESRHFIFVNYSAKAISCEVKPNYEIVDFIWVKPKEALNLELNVSTRNFIVDFLKKKT